VAVFLETGTATYDIVPEVGIRAGYEEMITMANLPDPYSTSAGFGGVSVGAADAAFDAGLRSHMLSIYNYMASAVLVTGVVALLFARSGLAYQVLAGGGLAAYALMFAPLVFVMVLSFGINRLQTSTAQMIYWAYAVVMGLSMASIFLVFTGMSIAQTFFATAAAFAGLSLYGYTTRRDLSAFGSFLVMGVVGILVASLINLFLHSTGLELAISILGVLIFAGLTAYDTQRLKSQYAYVAGTEFEGKAVVLGALSLYLDFVNMFMFLLRFLGNRN